MWNNNVSLNLTRPRPFEIPACVSLWCVDDRSYRIQDVSIETDSNRVASEDCWLWDSSLLSSAVLLWCDALWLTHSLVSPAGRFHVTLQSEAGDRNNAAWAVVQMDSRPMSHLILLDCLVKLKSFWNSSPGEKTLVGVFPQRAAVQSLRWFQSVIAGKKLSPGSFQRLLRHQHLQRSSLK